MHENYTTFRLNTSLVLPETQPFGHELPSPSLAYRWAEGTRMRMGAGMDVGMYRSILLAMIASAALIGCAEPPPVEGGDAASPQAECRDPVDCQDDQARDSPDSGMCLSGSISAIVCDHAPACERVNGLPVAVCNDGGEYGECVCMDPGPGCAEISCASGTWCVRGECIGTQRFAT